MRRPGRSLVFAGSSILILLLGIAVFLQRDREGVATVVPLATASGLPTATAEPSGVPSAVPASQLTLLFGGDVMLGRTVQTRMETFGSSWPFEMIASTLNTADITVVNLESPFKKDGLKTHIDSLILRGDPRGAEGMREAGIDVVSLANNHITDMGTAGVTDTKAILDAAGIAYTGAGLTTEDAERAAIIDHQGMKIGFLSYTYGVNIEKAGVVYNRAKVEEVTAAVQTLKKTVNTVVVLCHCGAEYSPEQNETQVAFSHAAIDAGASLVIGHHPHVPQPVEMYKSGLIVYSLGNLVFDQAPGRNRDRSALAKIVLKDARVESLTLIPYHIYSYGQPRLVTSEDEKRQIWQLFQVPQGILTFP